MNIILEYKKLMYNRANSYAKIYMKMPSYSFFYYKSFLKT